MRTLILNAIHLAWLLLRQVVLPSLLFGFFMLPLGLLVFLWLRLVICNLSLSVIFLNEQGVCIVLCRFLQNLLVQNLWLLVFPLLLLLFQELLEVVNLGPEVLDGFVLLSEDAVHVVLGVGQLVAQFINLLKILDPLVVCFELEVLQFKQFLHGSLLGLTTGLRLHFSHLFELTLKQVVLGLQLLNLAVRALELLGLVALGAAGLCKGLFLTSQSINLLLKLGLSLLGVLILREESVSSLL